jgi:hypothetical protein
MERTRPFTPHNDRQTATMMEAQMPAHERMEWTRRSRRSRSSTHDAALP